MPDELSNPTADLPMVTVVIPTYERLALLPQAIDSVIAQTYPRWELVVADDGSTDGAADWVRSLADARIRVVTRPHNGYLGYIRNYGVDAGSGQLVAFLNSDDLWEPGKLEMQVRAMRESGARWCFAGFEMMDDAGNPIPFRAGSWRPLSGRIIREVLTTEVGVSISSLIVDRAFFEEVGGFNETIYREDHELAMRLAMREAAVAVPDVLVRIREHGGRMSGVERSHELTAHIYGLFLDQNPPPDLARLARNIRSCHLADAGAHRLIGGDYGVAARFFARALVDGFPIGCWSRAVARGIRGRLRSRRAAP